MIKGILFDKDGTLIDFHELWQQIISNVLMNMQSKFDWTDEQIMAMGEEVGFINGALAIESVLQYKATTEIIELWLDVLGINDKTREPLAREILSVFDQASCNESLKIEPLKNVVDTLNKLKEMDLVLGVATADTYTSTIHSLNKAGLINYFSFFGTDSSEYKPKPNEDMALNFCISHQLTNRELLIVGDSDNDRCFAKQANAYFVGLKRKYNRFSGKDDNDYKIIDDFSEILSIIEVLNGRLV